MLLDYADRIGGTQTGVRGEPDDGDVAHVFRLAAGVALGEGIWPYVHSGLESSAPKLTADHASVVALLSFIADARGQMTVPGPMARTLLLESGAWRLAGQTVDGATLPPRGQLIEFCVRQACHPQAMVNLNGRAVSVDAGLADLLIGINLQDVTTLISSQGRTVLDQDPSIGFASSDDLARFLDLCFTGDEEVPKSWKFTVRITSEGDHRRVINRAQFPMSDVESLVSRLR